MRLFSNTFVKENWCYYSHENNECLSYDEFLTNIEINNFEIMDFVISFNYSYTKKNYNQYFSNSSQMPKSLLWMNESDFFIKIPWIDVFHMEIIDNSLQFKSFNKKVSYFDNFDNHTKKIEMYGQEIYVPTNLELYLSEYYSKHNNPLDIAEVKDKYIDKLNIKGIHGFNKNKIFFTVNLTNDDELFLLEYIHNAYTDIILKLYKNNNNIF